MRRSREDFLRRLHAACPYHVDLIPPPNGFSQATEDAIYEFIDARIGAMDMYGEVQDGLAFIRYCFLREEDANEFRARFAGIGKIINFPRAANG
jgi:hypothetical protein